jgi:hypothetical protein
MLHEELAVRGTAWLAALCYPAGPAGRVGAPRLFRAVWTAGLAALLLHIVAAFELRHGWSHRAAVEETARATREVTGLALGAGIWVNYVFAALWLADAAWWWADAPGHRRRAAWIHFGLHGFLLFLLFQATVVFARGSARWGGAVVTAAGVVALVAARCFPSGLSRRGSWRRAGGRSP